VFLRAAEEIRREVAELVEPGGWASYVAPLARMSEAVDEWPSWSRALDPVADFRSRPQWARR
jgi:hypothetical protein